MDMSASIVVPRAHAPAADSPVSRQTLSDFRADPIAFLRAVARDGGDWAPFHLGPNRCVLINEPRAIGDLLLSSGVEKGPGLLRARPLLGDGLLTADAATHAVHRKRLQPAFARSRVCRYASTMAARAQVLAERWRPDEILDIHREMNRLTLGIAGEKLFGIEIDDAEAADVGDALTTMLYALYDRLAPGSTGERLQGGRAEAAAALRRLRRVADRLIEKGRDGEADDAPLTTLLVRGGDGPLTEDAVRDEVLTFLLAGHESVANALSWTWCALAGNPEAATRFHAEVECLPMDRPLGYDDLPALGYTRRVLTESLRLFPPAWMVSRRAERDCLIAGRPLATGTIAIAAQCVTHGDARYFPDPARFDPDRWLPERSAARPRFAYFPFGAGKRACIGEQFAWTELVLILATLGRRWEMTLAPGFEPAMEPIVTLRPAGGMWMTLRERG
jgi:cytochrome P450